MTFLILQIRVPQIALEIRRDSFHHCTALHTIEYSKHYSVPDLWVRMLADCNLFPTKAKWPRKSKSSHTRAVQSSKILHAPRFKSISLNAPNCGIPNLTPKKVISIEELYTFMICRLWQFLEQSLIISNEQDTQQKNSLLNCLN